MEQVSDMSSSSDRTFCLRALAIVHADSSGHSRDSSTAAGSGVHNKIRSEVAIPPWRIFTQSFSRVLPRFFSRIKNQYTNYELYMYNYD